MNKAYDRVEYDFLEAILKKMGFHNNWMITLVMKCVSNVSFLVQVNGKYDDFFSPSRGLRQRDSLFPYIFLLVSEVLSLNLSKTIRNDQLQWIKLSRNCPRISHILFADDSLFFLKSIIPNCQSLNAILKDYCSALEQTINHEKSSLFFTSNTPPDLQSHI